VSGILPVGKPCQQQIHVGGPGHDAGRAVDVAEDVDEAGHRRAIAGMVDHQRREILAQCAADADPASVHPVLRIASSTAEVGRDACTRRTYRSAGLPVSARQNPRTPTEWAFTSGLHRGVMATVAELYALPADPVLVRHSLASAALMASVRDPRTTLLGGHEHAPAKGGLGKCQTLNVEHADEFVPRGGKADRNFGSEDDVARYGKDQKPVSRRRIIDAAGRRFKRGGIHGSGIAALMAEAGLTNGAFYAHFDSKNALVSATISDQLGAQCSNVAAELGDPGGVERFVREYLSRQHRDHPDLGCPSAALLAEIGRCPEGTKRAYTEGLLAVVDAIAAHLPAQGAVARVRVLNAFAGMVGTLQIARALTDEVLAQQLIDEGVRTALSFLAAVPPHAKRQTARR
jgi:TetR/AcrR family transcriptional repressor of nem operon